MLLIRTKVLPSQIHGLGVFSDQFIPAGVRIWTFTPGFDRKFTDAEVAAFVEPLSSYLKRYCWRGKKSGLWCFAADNAKYFNHSDTPNTLSTYPEDESECVTIALRDIQAGEELTDDYNAMTEMGQFAP